MFSRMQLLASGNQIAARFDAVDKSSAFSPQEEISGFEHACHPIILIENNTIVCDSFRWGLVPPDWKKGNDAIWNHTISAKLEYINKRYAWQKVSQSRCLVPATAYFEYHWNDAKGISKTKYRITHAKASMFALAGLYSVWQDKEGNLLKTFAVCTTQANETMQFVHNKDAARHYHRMPVMLNPEDELDWLDTSVAYLDFGYPNYQPDLIAFPLANTNVQTSLW